MLTGQDDFCSRSNIPSVPKMPACSVRPLSAELAQAAREELNEDPARSHEDLAHLRDWLSRQPHLRGHTDDQFLISFLRGAKFSLERAKEKVDSYYTIHSAVPEFFANRDPTTPMMKRIAKLGLFLPLGEDRKGRRVILLRVAVHDPKEMSIEDILKFDAMVLETLIFEDDVLTVKGVTLILDHKGMTIGHIGQYLPSIVYKAYTMFQDGYPLRQKALHYYNMPSFFETAFNLCKSMLKEKIRKRVFIDSDLDSLYKEIPKNILPSEYGGNAGSIAELAEYWEKKLLEWKQHFAEDAKHGSDETKRPGKSYKFQDQFGVEGSFRCLSVD